MKRREIFCKNSHLANIYLTIFTKYLPPLKHELFRTNSRMNRGENYQF